MFISAPQAAREPVSGIMRRRASQQLIAALRCHPFYDGLTPCAVYRPFRFPGWRSWSDSRQLVVMSCQLRNGYEGRHIPVSSGQLLFPRPLHAPGPPALAFPPRPGGHGLPAPPDQLRPAVLWTFSSPIPSARRQGPPRQFSGVFRLFLASLALFTFRSSLRQRPSCASTASSSTPPRTSTGRLRSSSSSEQPGVFLTGWAEVWLAQSILRRFALMSARSRASCRPFRRPWPVSPPPRAGQLGLVNLGLAGEFLPKPLSLLLGPGPASSAGSGFSSAASLALRARSVPDAHMLQSCFQWRTAPAPPHPARPEAGVLWCGQIPKRLGVATRRTGLLVGRHTPCISA